MLRFYRQYLDNLDSRQSLKLYWDRVTRHALGTEALTKRL